MRRAVLISLLVAACGAPGAGGPATTATPPAPSTTPALPPTTAEGGSPCSTEQGDFAEDGVIGVLGDEEGDADRVESLRWNAHEGCERFVVDLATSDGAPATRTGPVRAEVRRDLGLVRLELAEAVGETAIADATFDGTLASAAYVVRDQEGGIFVDLHLGAPAVAHAFALPSPARVVVDLRPDGGPLPSPAAVGDRVVLLSPRSGPVSYPLEVTGYARTFEANVLVRLRAGGEVAAEDFTTAADYLQTWGEFSVVLEEGPEGPVELFVGEESPAEGEAEGVELELQASG